MGRTIPRQHPNHRSALAARTSRAVPENGREKPSDKQSEIFDAAVRIFEQKGYHAASMQDLADAVGLQKASLYHYISSKEDLLVSVCERGTAALTEQLAEIAAAPLAPTQKLRRAIESHLVALCDQLELFTVFLREQRFFTGKQKAIVRAQAERHAELLETILEEGIRTGEFRRIDVSITAHAILGMCNWLYQWYSPEGPLSPRAIAANFADLIISGLAPRKETRRGLRTSKG